MNNETVQQAMSTGQALELAAAIVKALPKDLTTKIAQKWIGDKKSLRVLLNEMLLPKPIKRQFDPEQCKGYTVHRRWAQDVQAGQFCFLLEQPTAFGGKPLMLLTQEFTFADASNPNVGSLGRFALASDGTLHNLAQYETLWVVSQTKKLKLDIEDQLWVNNWLYLNPKKWLKAPQKRENITVQQIYQYKLLMRWGPKLAVRAFPECESLLC